MGSTYPGEGTGDPWTETSGDHVHGGRGRSLLVEMKTAGDAEDAEVESGLPTTVQAFFPFLTAAMAPCSERFFVSCVIPLRPRRPLRRWLRANILRSGNLNS